MNRALLRPVCFVILGGMATLAAAPSTRASEPFERVLEIRCAKCHTEKDKTKMSDSDLSPCGKECLKVMIEKLKFVHVPGKKYDDAAGKELTTKIARGLAGLKFKCP